MKEYKKSYKGLVVSMICYMMAMFGVAWIPTDDVNLITLLTINIMTIWLVTLTGMIYRNEAIYWYTGITFEEAEQISSDKRKNYAWKYFQRFLLFAILYLIYSIVAYLLHWPIAVDIIVVMIGIVVVAISTIPIKLKD